MMRRFMPALLLVLLWTLPIGVRAQVTNGNFETQRAASPPQGRNNIAGAYQAYDDLPGWRALANPNGAGAGSADFLATNAINPAVNPQGTPFGGTFMPHNNSTGCVVILREPGTYGYDQFISQQVLGLQPYHTYEVNFYVLRRGIGSNTEKILFAVNDSQPTGFTYSYLNGPVHDEHITPAPYATIVSAPITNYSDWTLVTGTFEAKANTSIYITIGYDKDRIDNQNALGSLYAIDDVSLTDLGCTIPNAPTVTRTGPAEEDCNHVAYYRIDNYDSNYTYTINRVYNATPFYPQPHTDSFFVKGGGGTSAVTYGRFTITATNRACGSSTTSDEIEVEYPCPEITPGYRSANTTTAYPNPATESITIPEGAEGATLISDKGKILRKADASGHLDVQSLPDGLYNLQMMQNGKLINQRIQVKH